MFDLSLLKKKDFEFLKLLIQAEAKLVEDFREFYIYIDSFDLEDEQSIQDVVTIYEEKIFHKTFVPQDFWADLVAAGKYAKEIRLEKYYKFVEELTLMMRIMNRKLVK